MSYESETLRHWYLLFHFGTPEEILAGSALDPSHLPAGCLDFPRASVELAQPESPLERALDLGCAVGRSTFELSRFAREVIGIDYSAQFIETAISVQQGETPAYLRYDEGHLSEELRAEPPPEAHPERIRFEQGDAMDLREDLGSFGLVHAANLVCRLPRPLPFLQSLPRLVAPGGLLVLATPATWMEEYTPRENQPVGHTLDFLRQHLEAHFALREVRELPFLIREHRRKFQLSSSETSVWIRH